VDLAKFPQQLLAVAFAFLLVACGDEDKTAAPAGPTAPAAPEKTVVEPAFATPVRNPGEGLEFTGAVSCRECHQEAYNDWTESHHHLAMQPATPETVLADFDDAEFEHFGHKSKFYRKGEEFWVNTENADGEREDFKIEYTFGVTPLQQYLIPFPGGRFQALQICWDSRPAEEGGQRWFHLYQDEAIPPDDVLHWTRRHFNWNYMCADCHSTDVDKNFDVETLTYDTTWSEMNVSCEACHGPGSGHIAWARDPENWTGEDHLGLVVKMSETEPGAWGFDLETGQPKRTHPLEHQNQLNTCAPCHAHRQPLQTQIFHGQDFLDTHLPSVLDEIHYHADGQIKEEVYVYGSFTQSKMFQNHVSCSDCHHPHTSKVYAIGNDLCVRCHQPAKYDTPAHHFHFQPESTGASCVECHMPPKYYMVVDKRRDHSIRIPRPDLSEEYGTPNACTTCHTDKDNAWAAEAFKTWWGEKAKPNWTHNLARGRSDSRTYQDDLRALAANLEAPGIGRASALNLLKLAPTQAALESIVAQLEDPDPLTRHHAMSGLDLLQPEQRQALGAKLLLDPVRAVRIEAARVLASARAGFKGDDRKALDNAIDEYLEAQKAVSDVPEGHVALALLYADLNSPEMAESEYRIALKIDPTHVASRVNLSEMLFQLGRSNEAGTLLLEGAKVAPNDGFIQEALGRNYIREKQYDLGLAHLAKAVELQPERPELRYFLAVGYNSTGRFPDAYPHLKRAVELDPKNPEYLSGALAICRDNGQFELAIYYLDRLAQVQPNPQLQQLRQQLLQLKKQSGQ
jgi:tetratricopeptide (TPR) repeat protein